MYRTYHKIMHDCERLNADLYRLDKIQIVMPSTYIIIVVVLRLIQ